MKLAVVGSREFSDNLYLYKQLEKLFPSQIITGGARGVDKIATAYAKANNIPYLEIKPNYSKYPSKAAPVIRNKEIIASADRVLAIWDGKSPGTKNAIIHAYELNKPVIVKLFNQEVRIFKKASEIRKIDFIAAKVEPGEMKQLREFKKKMASGQLSYNHLQLGIESMYSGIRNKILSLPKNTNLIMMPSGSGKNKIPQLIFAEIKKDRPDIRLFNDPKRNYFIDVDYFLQSKNKSRYDLRIDDLKNFIVHQSKEFDELKNNPHNYIFDDIISTGDTAVLLERMLESKGIPVRGILSAKSNELYLTTARDMQRIYERILTTENPRYLPKGNQLENDIFDNFAGFLRRKATNFEIDLHRNKYLQQPGFAVKYLHATAEQYRKLGIESTKYIGVEKGIGQDIENQTRNRPYKR